jgi:hypothetical protein
MSSEGIENALMASTEGGAGVMAGGAGLPPAPAAAALSSSSMGGTGTCQLSKTENNSSVMDAGATHELCKVCWKRARHEGGQRVGNATYI